MKKIITYFFCCFIIQLSSSTNDFETFKIRYNKTYHNDAEDFIRQRIFQSNVDFINRHNSEAKKGRHTYKLDVNRFADMTKEEWTTKLGLISQRPRSEKKFVDNNIMVNRPDSVDWRDEGCVTAVVDQGPLGRSWTYSATGAMEGELCIKEDELVGLSSLDLQECCTGCMSVRDAYLYTMDTGINTSSDYPPFPIDGSCKFDESKRVVKIEGYKEVSEGDENDLTDKIATEGPISVCIDASSIMFYSSGVFYDPRCSPNNINHCMLAVGWFPG